MLFLVVPCFTMLFHFIPCFSLHWTTFCSSLTPPNPIPDGDMMGAPGEDDSIHVAKKKAAEDLANKMQEKQKKKEADE